MMTNNLAINQLQLIDKRVFRLVNNSHVKTHKTLIKQKKNLYFREINILSLFAVVLHTDQTLSI